MNCAACQELLLELAYGELTPLRAAEVELHLASCRQDCRAELERIRRTRASFAPLFSPQAQGASESPSADFDGPILAAARAAAETAKNPQAKKGRVIRLAARARPRWMRAAVATSLAAAAALALVVSNRHRGLPSQATVDPEAAGMSNANQTVAQLAAKLAPAAPPSDLAGTPAPLPSPSAGGGATASVGKSSSRGVEQQVAREAPPAAEAMAGDDDKALVPERSLAINGGDTSLDARDSANRRAKDEAKLRVAEESERKGSAAFEASKKFAPPPPPADNLPPPKAIAAAPLQLHAMASNASSAPAPLLAPPPSISAASPRAKIAVAGKESADESELSDVDQATAFEAAARNDLAAQNLAAAARAYVQAARIRRASAPDLAAYDLAQAVICSTRLGDLSAARAIREQIAAIAPLQSGPLKDADAAIEERVSRQQQSPAATAPSAAPR